VCYVIIFVFELFGFDRFTNNVTVFTLKFRKNRYKTGKERKKKELFVNIEQGMLLRKASRIVRYYY
jgi:hypothetical protein